jgi:hypothetical protein
MSVKHITAAFERSKAKLAPRFVLVCLSNFASPDGICYPSIKTIAEYCGMCERAVHNAIDQLIELKELEIVEKGGTINGKKLSNVYRVILPLDGCIKCTGAPDARVHLVPETGASGSKGRVHQMHTNRHEEEPPKETTTTTRACARAKATVLVEEAPSSFSSVPVVTEELTDKLTPEDRLELEQIANDFGSDGRQKAKAEACAKRRGMAFVREQADIVRTKPDVRNLAGAFEKACDSPDGWKRPKAAAKKPARRKPADPKPEEAPSEPLADFSAELAWWQSASPAQREDILRHPCFDLYRKSMRKGVTAASLGLPVLREVLAELAQEAACAATEMVKAQQPEQEAA